MTSISVAASLYFTTYIHERSFILYLHLHLTMNHVDVRRGLLLASSDGSGSISLSGPCHMEALSNSKGSLCSADGEQSISNFSDRSGDSLHFLIARARRGGRRPSATGKPGPASYAPNGRLHAPHMASSRPPPSPTFHWNEVQQLVDDCQRDAITDQRRPQEEDHVNHSGLKRTPSSTEAPQTLPMSATTTTTSRTKSRRLTPSISTVSDDAVVAVAAVSPDGNRGILRLPDPSSSSRRDLFYMSRRMCSYSSIDSFTSNEEDTIPRQRVVSDHERTARIMEEEAKAQEQEDDHSIMSVEHQEEEEDLSDDESMFSDDLSCDLEPTGGDDDDDDESIAFSMDSVDMRKKQFVASHNGSSPARAAAPFRHIVCDTDADDDDDAVLQKCFQLQARLKDDRGEQEEEVNDDASLASL